MTADISSHIDALTSAAHSLEHDIVDLTDEQARGRSLLPGWTRGHVLSHIARNADGLTNLVAWARTGVETPMYASRAQRNADIEAGSSRPAADLVADVRGSQDRFMAALTELPGDRWQARIRFGAANREGEAAMIPWLRRTEVEVHHVDLDLDYTLAHLPEDFVEAMLEETTRDYSGRDDVPGFTLLASTGEGEWPVAGGGPVISGPPPALLGWLIGRSDGVGLHSDVPLPRLGVWR